MNWKRLTFPHARRYHAAPMTSGRRRAAPRNESEIDILFGFLHPPAQTGRRARHCRASTPSTQCGLQARRAVSADVFGRTEVAERTHARRAVRRRNWPSHACEIGCRIFAVSGGQSEPAAMRGDARNAAIVCPVDVPAIFGIGLGVRNLNVSLTACSVPEAASEHAVAAKAMPGAALNATARPSASTAMKTLSWKSARTMEA